jgi:hypothetical protein
MLKKYMEMLSKLEREDQVRYLIFLKFKVFSVENLLKSKPFDQRLAVKVIDKA